MIVYDIPRTVNAQVPEVMDTTRFGMFGSVDYGPNYGIEDDVTFDQPYSAVDAARLYGNYLARNYQDDFRQVEVLSPDYGPNNVWRLRIHMAWGDRPYYNPI